MLLTTQMPLGYTETFPETNQPRSHSTANCKSQSFFPPPRECSKCCQWQVWTEPLPGGKLKLKIKYPSHKKSYQFTSNPHHQITEPPGHRAPEEWEEYPVDNGRQTVSRRKLFSWIMWRVRMNAHTLRYSPSSLLLCTHTTSEIHFITLIY